MLTNKIKKKNWVYNLTLLQNGQETKTMRLSRKEWANRENINHDPDKHEQMKQMEQKQGKQWVKEGEKMSSKMTDQERSVKEKKLEKRQENIMMKWKRNNTIYWNTGKK